MQFDVDRIAVLAGLGGGRSSGLMKEAAMVDPKGPPPAASKTAPPVPAAAKAAPAAAPAKAKPVPEGDYEEGMHYEGAYEEGMHDEDMSEMYTDEMTYEIDETDLMEALVDMRERRLEESRVRSAVRSELSSIINEMESGSRWLYGNRQPTNSSQGRVSRGFMGPGFR